jgi:uncharacterized membrane protein
MLKKVFRAVPLFLMAIAVAAGPAGGGEAVDSDLVIPLRELSTQVKYYDAVVEGERFSLFAIIAPDNTERVVLNSCQSCGPAGYRQQGDAVACIACGQKFKISELEKGRRTGCNPIPVGVQNRRRDGDDIVIPLAFLKQVKDYYTKNNWLR